MKVDFIIIGAGSAGCVLANRLSEDPGNSVLLVEAGDSDKKREIHIPAAFSELFKTSVDWAYESTPQPSAAGRKLFLPRGKVLGGSSSINAMIYIRGNKADYDHWAELGNPGWGYDDLLPYFMKGEKNERIEDGFHGTKGELSIVDPNDPRELSKAFIEAAKEAGFEVNDDFNGKQQEGFGLYQVTQQAGKRMSTAGAFLKPVLKRKNLTVLTKAEVESLLWTENRVSGIRYRKNGVTEVAEASKEVIVSAGTYNTPKLLLLSGIGPSEELQELGIQVRKHAPGVGKNLQDHLIVPMVFDTYAQSTLETARGVSSLVNYLLWAEGPLSSNVAEAGGFIKTLPDLQAPDIQFHFGPGYFYNHGFGIPTKGYGYSLGPTLLQPESTGEVKLASPEGSVAPLIDHQYLTGSEDVETLVRGFQAGMKIINSSRMKSYFRGYHLPDKRLVSESDIATHIREQAQTLYHPVGTARMGIDKDAVVDARLRVKGVPGLRVVDASVMPKIVRGNTNAPVIAIAEKAADMILEDYQVKKKSSAFQQGREGLTTEQ